MRRTAAGDPKLLATPPICLIRPASLRHASNSLVILDTSPVRLSRVIHIPEVPYTLAQEDAIWRE